MTKLKQFSEVKKMDWPKHKDNLQRVFLSRDFLVQQYQEEGAIRISVCKTKMKGSLWVDGITWDELQQIKSMVGFGDKCAVEVYPEDKNVVNVANMRHLFILEERPIFAWGK